ncbi:hypothetical protein F5887DRAFT_1049329 [Amanita rubescens]|nr:hypothetical protein F5887DRAFT_1049329 [Amanita rubescens]
MSSFTPSKRHSLHIYSSSGPKPLQLVTGQAPSPITPATPDHQNKPRTLRRQSSISYKRSSYDSLAQSRPPNEVDSPPLGGGLKPRPRSVAYPAAPLLTPQLTLAEKHADLLQFIAQKESKCLELRSQLAMHEAELLQLKRTWERIVSRNFEFPHSTLATTVLNASTSSPPTIYYAPGSSNAVLEGIKEGVQGVSRLITAGLSISNTDHPTTHTYHTLSESRPNAKPTPKPRPHSLYSPLSSSSPISHIRSSNLSTSSTCTTATSATKTTSHDVEQKLKNSDELCQYATESTNGSPDSLGSQELIVRDTGATPTVSPNPKFKFRIERRRERENKRGRKDREVEAEDAWGQLGSISIQDNMLVGKDEQRKGTLRTLTANSSAINIDAGSTRCHRRKSRETSAASLGSLRHEESEARTPFSPDLSTSGRSSLPAMPVSSIPGLSLAESAAMLIGGDLSPSVLNVSLPPLSLPNSNSNHESRIQVLPPSSWTKRWTLSKSQKRASLLLSDVSQTLVSAFSLAVGSGSGSGSGSSCVTSASGASSSSSSLVLSTPPPPLPPPGAKPASMSLIDEDDDDEGNFFSAASVATVMEPMKPVLVGVSASGQVSQARTGTDVQVTVEVEEDDGEWGW